MEPAFRGWETKGMSASGLDSLTIQTDWAFLVSKSLGGMWGGGGGGGWGL